MKKKKILIFLFGLIIIGIPFTSSWSLTTVKVGALKLSSTAPIFIGMDKGFFESEGIKVEPVWFKAAQPIAVATATGDIDVGATGLTAGLYNSIGQGMKIAVVADKGREWPGYKLTALLVNTEQWKAGVRDLKDLKGKRVGITQIGSTFHYILGNLLEKKGMSLNDVKVVPLGSISSMRDTLLSNQIESVFLNQPLVAGWKTSGNGQRPPLGGRSSSLSDCGDFLWGEIDEKSTCRHFVYERLYPELPLLLRSCLDEERGNGLSGNSRSDR